MSSMEKITVEKTYFDALLRRANLHAQVPDKMTCSSPDQVVVSQLEYQSLLLVARQFEHLKTVLVQGGVTAETLDLLVADVNNAYIPSGQFSTGLPLQINKNSHPTRPSNQTRSNFDPAVAAISSTRSTSNSHGPHPGHRQVSHRMTSCMEDNLLEDGDHDSVAPSMATNGVAGDDAKQTLFFSGIPQETTYLDFLSVIKGGKIVNAILLSDGKASVTFLDNAGEYLAWAKRTNLSLHGKRIEVMWANRQYTVHAHIHRKIAMGATRNILVQSASEKGLTEQQIRDDLEHIHNLVVVDIEFRNGSAFIQTNSIRSALYARTCMLSRATYKGCRVDSFPDGCDVPLPVLPPTMPLSSKRVVSGETLKKNNNNTNNNSKVQKSAPANRFNVLRLSDEGSSDAENHSPLDLSDSDEETLQTHSGVDLASE